MNFLQEIYLEIFLFRNPRASLARAAFPLKLSLIPAIDLLPPCLWVKSESEVKSIFGPLNFFVFRYVEGGVLGNNYISIKKCRTTFLWEWSSTQVGGRKNFFQNLTTGMIFSKMVSNLSVLEGIFETKFQGWFFFRKNFKGISHIKFTTFLKIKKKFKGISLLEMKGKKIQEIFM